MFFFCNFGCSFGLIRVVDGVSFDIVVGEFVGVIGCLGVGKFMFLCLINWLIDLMDGSVYFGECQIMLFNG